MAVIAFQHRFLNRFFQRLVALFTRATKTCSHCGGTAREHIGFGENLMICLRCGHEEISD